MIFNKCCVLYPDKFRQTSISRDKPHVDCPAAPDRFTLKPTIEDRFKKFCHLKERSREWIEDVCIMMKTYLSLFNEILKNVGIFDITAFL